MFRLFLAGLALVGQAAASQSQQQVLPIVLEGTLVTKAGRPVAGRTIFVFPIDDANRIKRFPGISADGYLLPIEPKAHAHGRTGANGRFRITYGSVTAVTLSDDKVLIAGLDDPGLTIGVFKRENLRALQPPDDNPLFLVPAPGASPPRITTGPRAFLIQYGKVMIPQ